MSYGRSGQSDRIWDVIECTGVCMLTTQFAGGLRARPLEPRPDRDARIIWFLTDARSAKGQEVAAEHDVALIFIDQAERTYLSVTARAHELDDRAKAAEIWRASDRLWWAGPEDPNLRVLRVTPLLAEFWDEPSSKAGEYFEFVKAMLGAGKPNLGENRKVSLRLR